MEMMKSIGPTILDGVEVNTVNARELKEKLGVEGDFSHWIKRQIERARLAEGRDFITLVKKHRRQYLTEYYLTVDSAKHVAMICGSEKGYEIREYFIEFEKKCQPIQQTFKVPQTFSEALKLAADQAEKIEKQQAQIVHLEKTKAHISDKKTATAVGKLGGTVKALNAAKDRLGEGKTWKIANHDYDLINCPPYHFF